MCTICIYFDLTPKIEPFTDRNMKKRFTEEQIVNVLQKHSEEKSVAEALSLLHYSYTQPGTTTDRIDF